MYKIELTRIVLVDEETILATFSTGEKVLVGLHHYEIALWPEAGALSAMRAKVLALVADYAITSGEPTDESYTKEDIAIFNQEDAYVVNREQLDSLVEWLNEES